MSKVEIVEQVSTTIRPDGFSDYSLNLTLAHKRKSW
jgi:hypothetical protein